MKSTKLIKNRKKLIEDCGKLIESGLTLDAFKLYREETGVQLLESEEDLKQLKISLKHGEETVQEQPVITYTEKEVENLFYKFFTEIQNRDGESIRFRNWFKLNKKK